MNPNKPITRLEMMILVRAHQNLEGDISIDSKEVDQILNKYKDKSKVPDWAKIGVAKAIKKNITSSVEKDKLGTGEKGNRVQSALFSHRLNKTKEEEKQNAEFVPIEGTEYSIKHLFGETKTR